jgi:flagellar biogenesis protein FliO
VPGSSTASYGDLLVTALGALIAISVAALVVVRIVGRRLAAPRAQGAPLIDVVARVPLEPRRALYVIEVGGKALLLGASELGLSVLSELDPAVTRDRVLARATFADLVRGAWARRPTLQRGARAEAVAAASVDAAGTGGASPGDASIAQSPSGVGAAADQRPAGRPQGADHVRAEPPR